MDSFPSIQPKFIINKNSNKRTLIADIAGHFKQRTNDGINTEEEVWDIEWVVNQTNADTIEDFLEGKEGYQAFEWTPLDDTTAVEFICRQWSKSILGKGMFRLTATFERFYTHE